MAKSEVNFDEIAFVDRSKYRTLVIEHLDEHSPCRPSDIVNETGAGFPHVSRALQSLREEGMVELLVAEDTKKGRYYGLSEHGKNVKGRFDEVMA